MLSMPAMRVLAISGLQLVPEALLKLLLLLVLVNMIALPVRCPEGL